MNELSLEGFQKAIRATHGAQAKLAGRVSVLEMFKGEAVWKGRSWSSISWTIPQPPGATPGRWTGG